MTLPFDFLRVVTLEEWSSRHKARGGRALYPGLSPLGGCVVARRGTATLRLLCSLYTRGFDPAACLQPELLPTIHPGLKAEFLFSDVYKPQALALLKVNKRARDYIASLQSLPREDLPRHWDWRGDELLELQSVTRSISAAAQCFDVLAELGIKRR